MNSRDDNEAKALWRSQRTEVPAMPMTYLRHRAEELERSFRVRNWLEQCAAVLAFIAYAVALFRAPGVWNKLGISLVLLGMAYAWLQWRRRASPRSIPAFECAQVGLTFYKRELERKRDLHLGLWRWYVLPILPGIAVLMAWSFFGDPHTRGTSVPWTIAAIVVGWIALALSYERIKAARYQREIDALGSVEAATESPSSR